MRQYLISLATALAVALTHLSGAIAAPEIKDDQYVKNRGDGYCGWCSLEMCLLSTGHASLRGLTDRRENTYIMGPGGVLIKTPGATFVGDLVSELNHYKVKHRAQYDGNVDQSILKKALKEDLPVVIGLRDYPKPGVYHAVVLIGLNSFSARIVDPNAGPAPVRVGRDVIDKQWTGYAVVVEAAPKKVPEKVPEKAVPVKATEKAPSKDLESRYDIPPGLGWSATPGTGPGRIK